MTITTIAIPSQLSDAELVAEVTRCARDLFEAEVFYGPGRPRGGADVVNESPHEGGRLLGFQLVLERVGVLSGA